ncbi:hypothetical protein BKA70DRAFT_1327123 [Coprinopsis sp. MPI-PUGE-AT-0042]|nr:hypothetical protein BKA70DRAFT_1327123 [Coprinopsis sp. MPI-PUGE-AT-0042]
MSGAVMSSSSTLYTTLIPTAHATAAVVLETPPPTTSAFKTIFRAIYQPIPVALFLLSPITTFLHYLAAVFFFIPYTYGLYVATEVIHPIYVFCGVACLTGVLLGLLGRTLSALLVASVLPSRPSDRVKLVTEQEGQLKAEPRGNRWSRKGKARQLLESEDEDEGEDVDDEDESEGDWSEVSLDSGRRKPLSASSAGSSTRRLKRES